MANSKLPIVRLSELEPGQLGEFFALLSERHKKTNREGKPFYACRFRDARRSADFKAWMETPWYECCEREWQTGHFYRIQGVYGAHERYGAHIDIFDIRPVTEEDRAEGFDPGDFVEHTRQDPEAMFTELRMIAATAIGDEPLRRLVTTLLDRHAQALKRLPATTNKFHPFYGGLIEHTLSVTKHCQLLVERYATYYSELQPPLNRDLVVAGAILHDFGRVLEFETETLPPQLTVPGRLFGHLFLGRDLARDTARELGDVNPELVQMLEHIIITHLTLPEWGSPRLPLIPECLIIHHADDLDAKMEMYVRCLSRDQAAGRFTNRDPVLNRELYKGRSV